SLLVSTPPGSRNARMPRLFRVNLLVVLLAFVSSGGQPALAAESVIAVDAAVVLAADVSRSIDDGEFALQRKGYADAIEGQRLIDAISTGPHGAIALAYVEWA